MLQCVAVRCSALQGVAVCGSVLQYVAVCARALYSIAFDAPIHLFEDQCCSVLQCVAVLQRVAVLEFAKESCILTLMSLSARPKQSFKQSFMFPYW